MYLLLRHFTISRQLQAVNDHRSNPIRLYEPAEESESNLRCLAKVKIQQKLGHGAYSQVFGGHFEDTPMAFKIFRRIAMRTYQCVVNAHLDHMTLTRPI